MSVVDLSCGLHYVYYELVAMHGCCGFVMWVVWICHVGGTMCIMCG